MRKIIKKWGDGVGIYLDKEDCKAYSIKEGQIYEVEIKLVDVQIG
jgi:hypothetical protein